MVLKIAKTLQYDYAHEKGIVRTTDERYWIIEGPITQDGPYRWIAEDCNYEAAKQKYQRELERPL